MDIPSFLPSGSTSCKWTFLYSSLSGPTCCQWTLHYSCLSGASCFNLTLPHSCLDESLASFRHCLIFFFSCKQTVVYSPFSQCHTFCIMCGTLICHTQDFRVFVGHVTSRCFVFLPTHPSPNLKGKTLGTSLALGPPVVSLRNSN